MEDGGLMRKICYPPNRRGDGQGDAKEDEEGSRSNEISYGQSGIQEIQMFALSQIRVSNLFFLFISILDQIYKESPLGRVSTDADDDDTSIKRVSTILPLLLVIGMQAVIATVAYFKDKKRLKKINERADFRLAELPKGSGPPKFLKRSLDHIKPGDLLSFEPKPGEKVISCRG